METQRTTEDREDKLAAVLGNVLKQSVNEGLVLAQLEAFEFFNPMPASIPLGEGTTLEASLDKLSATLGGPPRLVIVLKGERRPHYDTYAEAAIGEIVSCFMRARTSVCRSHLYFIGSSLISKQPELMHLPDDPELRRILVGQVEESFWEHAETSYIRLASFWDRLGQLLDFVFFHIRRYERDGFPAVLDRIRTNVVPMNAIIRDSMAWQRLRRFQTSDETNGLKWLLRRRNLLVHSLHLSPQDERQEDPVFTSAYNHLEEAAREKLRPGDMKRELNQLHEHLKEASNLFADAIELALLGVAAVPRA